jgi:two-component sensor histidine kinase
LHFRISSKLLQITALLRIQNAQAINEAARARDQQALIDRLSALEANHASLAENLSKFSAAWNYSLIDLLAKMFSRAISRRSWHL